MSNKYYPWAWRNGANPPQDHQKLLCGRPCSQTTLSGNMWSRGEEEIEKKHKGVAAVLATCDTGWMMEIPRSQMRFCCEGPEQLPSGTMSEKFQNDRVTLEITDWSSLKWVVTVTNITLSWKMAWKNGNSWFPLWWKALRQVLRYPHNIQSNKLTC